MIPKPDTALSMLSQRLMQSVVPACGSSYVMSDGAMTAMLIAALGQEMASGIDRRVTDGRAMLELLREGRAGGYLTDELSVTIEDTPASYRLADVNAWHDRLTHLVIRLHEKVEAAGDAELNDAIWQYLHDMAGRHQVPL